MKFMEEPGPAKGDSMEWLPKPCPVGNDWPTSRRTGPFLRHRQATACEVRFLTNTARPARSSIAQGSPL